MKLRRPNFARLIIAICLCLGGTVIIYDTRNIQAISNYDRIGPTAFPYTVAFCLIICAVATFISAYKPLSSASIAAEDEAANVQEKHKIAPVIWIIAGLVAQMLLLNYAGFSIASGIMFAAVARGFGKKPLWLNLLIGIILSSLIWLFFTKILQLNLPMGHFEKYIL